MLAVIGGSGLGSLPSAEVLENLAVNTAYAAEPVSAQRVSFAGGGPLIFLPRHGPGHATPPHRINYRANIDALRSLGSTHVIGVYAVGGIQAELGPGSLAVPDQLIDYSYGRENSFYDGEGEEGVVHIDFSYPYDQSLRDLILASLTRAGVERSCLPRGVYGCTAGPRLETAAEIRRLRADGCDMVGMTGMPEAALAREAGLAFAALALSVNWAAGLTEDLISMEQIYQTLDEGMASIEACLQQASRLYEAGVEASR